MIDRAYELAEEAGAYCESLRGGDYKPPILDQMNLEEYTRLIVLECSRMIETREPRTEPAAHIYLIKAFGFGYD
jgi:hypothetical protein